MIGLISIEFPDQPRIRVSQLYSSQAHTPRAMSNLLRSLSGNPSTVKATSKELSEVNHIPVALRYFNKFNKNPRIPL